MYSAGTHVFGIALSMKVAILGRSSSTSGFHCSERCQARSSIAVCSAFLAIRVHLSHLLVAFSSTDAFQLVTLFTVSGIGSPTDSKNRYLKTDSNFQIVSFFIWDTF